MAPSFKRFALLMLLLGAARALDEEAQAANGFRAVHLFVGITDKPAPLPKDRRGSWHAQAGQDRIIADVFNNKREGFFVDLAANHPVYLSNTRTLERDYGWRGICIDGNLELLNELARHRTCTVVGSVVSASRDSTVSFRKYQVADWQTNASSWEHGLSGIVTAPSWWEWLTGAGAKHGEAVTTVVERAKSTTLVNILETFKMPHSGVDFLSLDVEGAEEDVLREFPFETIPIRTITVERPKPAVRKLLRRHNFTYARDIGVNLDELWLHGSMADRVSVARARNCPAQSCVVNHD